MADFAAIRFQPSRPLLRELSADRLNSILAEIRRNKPLPGRGITVRQTGQGTAIDFAASIPRSTTTHPFQLLAASGQDPNAAYVRVVYGTVNGERPDGMSVGDDPPYILELTNPSGVIFLGATLDDETFEINSLWIDQDSEIPEETELEIYLEIGSYTLVDGRPIFAQSVTSSLAYIRAGFINLWGQA